MSEGGPEQPKLKVDRLARAMEAARGRAQAAEPPLVRATAPLPAALPMSAPDPAAAAPGPPGGPAVPAPAAEPPVTAVAAAADRLILTSEQMRMPPAQPRQPAGPPAAKAEAEPPQPRKPAPPALLSLTDVHTDIGRYHVLEGVSFEVPSRGVTMLLGRNGAGKTTTLRTIMGLWRAKAGTVRLGGLDIAGWPAHRIARRGVGYVPEDMGIFGALTVAENMRLAAASGRIPQDRLDAIFRIFPALRTFWHGAAGNLSGGQKQMLALARAMVEKRDLYLIDEPTKGLAPAIVATLTAALRELKLQGATILMVEQNLAVARALGDTCVVMDDGKVAWRGPMAVFAGDDALQARLLGLDLERT